MVLTETGESRLRGYLYVLERSLSLALPRAVVVILIGLVCGLGALVLTHRGARRYLGWWRGRRASWRTTT